MVQCVECRAEVDLDVEDILPGVTGIFKGHDEQLELLHRVGLFTETFLGGAEDSVPLCVVSHGSGGEFGPELVDGVQ